MTPADITSLAIATVRTRLRGRYPQWHEDIAQEAALLGWKADRDGHRVSSFAMGLFVATAVERVLGDTRKNGRRRVADSSIPDEAVALMPSHEDAQKRECVALCLRRLHAAWPRLSRVQRAALVAYLEDRTMLTAAREHGTTHGSFDRALKVVWRKMEVASEP